MRALPSVNKAAALAAPGVLAVLTGADYAADGLGPIPHNPGLMAPPDVQVRTRGFEPIATVHFPLPAGNRPLCRRTGRHRRRRDHRRGQGCGGIARHRLRAVAGGDARRRCAEARRAASVGERAGQSLHRCRGRRRGRHRRRLCRAPRMSSGSKPGRSASPACRWSRAPMSPNTMQQPAGTRFIPAAGAASPRSGSTSPRCSACRPSRCASCATTWAAISARATSSTPNTRCSPGRRGGSAGRSNGPASGTNPFSATGRAAI